MNYFDPLRTFFLALVCKPHDSSHVMRDTHTNGRGDSAAQLIGEAFAVLLIFACGFLLLAL
jgi:hypothetical protein